MAALNIAELTLSEILALDASRREAEAAETARLLAELEILVAYDDDRELAGHDYGRGQRWAELSRRRRILRDRGVDETTLAVGVSGATPDELSAAFDRVGRPRLARARRQPRGDGTPPTIRTWERIERIYARSSS